MLMQSNLTSSLWAEAVNTAYFIRNRCPKKTLDNTTPLQAWTDRKPYVGFMRIFGSRVIAHIKGPVRDKFNPTGDEYILMGYSEESKAYRLWKPGTRSVRRDVRFVEKLSETIELPLNSMEEPINTIVNDTNEEQGESDIGDNDEVGLPNEPVGVTGRAPGRPRIERTGKLDVREKYATFYHLTK